ncbi:hypothetical protein BGZ76_006338 [Entomortierella beljakovae]|nr:hypothetical protein BGZ76_006338 [Entomortierella beljakovae]
MLIDDSSHDDLKAHLTKELTLISDADPGMLADYIIALLKHDKDNSELKSLCISQLEDFLLQETEPFVTSLFKVLENKSYIQGKSASKSTPAVASSASTSTSNQGNSKSSNVENDDEYIPTGPAADRKPANSSSRGRSEKHHRGESEGSDDEDRSYKHARRDEERDDRRRRDYSPSRPSDDDRSGGRRGRTNDFGGSNGHSDHDRRGDRGIRQQGLTTAGYNSRNNTHNINNNNNNFNGMNNNQGGMDRQQWNGPQQNRNYDNSPRGNFQDQNQGSWRGGSNARGGRGGMHNSSQGFNQPKRQRCRDYDEKGYCMRGDMCQFDHGEDRIVVDDVPNVPFDMMGVVPSMGPNGMMGMGVNRPPFFPGGPNSGMMPNPTDIYDPEAALALDGMGVPGQGAEQFENRNQQGGPESGRFGQDPSTRGSLRGRGGLRGMRGARGRGGASHPYAVQGRFPGAASTGGVKSSLVVEHIPDEFNTIDKVNEFFKQFGSLTNIQVDQSAHKALIQYSTREEANAAYNSPDVIFGNRFVKVYWQPDDVDAATFGRLPKPTGQVRPEKSSTPAPPHGHHAQKPPAASVLMTPERAAELAAERAASAAKMEETKKTMQEIQRQREALIQRQQEEQKLILQKMFAKKAMSQQDKDEILKGLKNVAIEVTKEPVDPLEKARAAAAAAEAQRQAELHKDAERKEKERLDRELEVLNTVPSEGTSEATPPASATPDAAETTAALKARLATLQAQAAALGIDGPGGYAGRGRGGIIRGRGRGAMSNTWTRGGARGGAVVSHHRTFRIDNRSAKISVENVEETSKDGLKEHFETFGELESFSLGPDGTTATVQYKTRKDAETAMQQGSQAPAATTPLKLGWISDPSQASGITPGSDTAKSTAPGGAGELGAAGEATVGYESEEEEDGERSWKR